MFVVKKAVEAEIAVLEEVFGLEVVNMIGVKVSRVNIRVLNSEIFDQNLKQFQIRDMVVSPGEHPERYP